MWRYALRRIAFLPVIIFVVSVITFVLLRVLPDQDPAVLMAGQNATPQQVQAIHELLGLDKPIVVQYIDWMSDVWRGDLGETYFGRRDIGAEVLRRFPASAELVLLSLIVSVIVGVSFGVLSAVMRNSSLDYIVRLSAVFGQSIPDFFLLILLIIIPSIIWNYAAPIGGYVAPWDDPLRNIRIYVPPSLILGIGGAAGIMRLQRTTMLEVLGSDYVRTARAKGLGAWNVIIGHAMRNTLAPLVTVIGTSFTVIFAGSVIAERVMSIDGLGVFFLDSAIQRDFPVVQFLVLYTATVVIVVNLIVDLSYAIIDPRVKYR
ncbi:MAG: ABC transporter permease [Chloroflexi bacterium]|nr:ABC transporter permease [Chloroflexota bacterium]MCH8065644.1 ABC transporter permease [Chloroflexota bacterium]